MDALWLILALIIGLAVGALVGWLIGSRKASPGGDAAILAAAQAATAAAQATADERSRQIEEANARNRELVEQQERDAKIVAELTPIKAVLDQMTRKVNEMENQQKEQHGLISQQLVDSRKAGDELRATTDALSQALRSNNYKGKWGEDGVDVRCILP